MAVVTIYMYINFTLHQFLTLIIPSIELATNSQVSHHFRYEGNKLQMSLSNTTAIRSHLLVGQSSPTIAFGLGKTASKSRPVNSGW